jgi:hypothetical protein
LAFISAKKASEIALKDLASSAILSDFELQDRFGGIIFNRESSQKSHQTFGTVTCFFEISADSLSRDMARQIHRA